MRVITIMKHVYRQETCNVSSDLQETTDGSSVTCRAAAFTYWNIEKENPKLQELLSCASVYNDTAEVVFQNMSWTHFPSEFITLFPNLQSLQLPYNNFTMPPEMFPWTNQTLFCQEIYLEPFTWQIINAYHSALTLNQTNI